MSTNTTDAGFFVWFNSVFAYPWIYLTRWWLWMFINYILHC